MGQGLVQGTSALMRFIVQRDRLRLPLWLLSFVAMSCIIAFAFTGLYQNDAERQAMAETMRNPAMTAMVGPGYGLDNYTIGAMLSHEMLLMTAVVVGLMNILLLSRHTRADEEDGRLEMIRSLPVGRLSNLLSVLLVLFGVNVLLAVLTAVFLIALNIDSIDARGSFVYGFALGSAGMVFAAIAAVFAQLSQSSRGTVGFSIAALLLAYMIRAIGDLSGGILSLFSPLGWILRTEAYVNNYWWPIFLTAGAALVLSSIALYLNSVRDIGSGFLPVRAGRPHASKGLANPFGLAFRLQRTGLIAWAAGLMLISASYGSVLGDMESFFEDIDLMQQLIVQQSGFSITEQFIPVLMSVMAILGTIPVLMAVLKVKGEETNGRLEHILSKAVSKNGLLGSYVLLAVLASFVILGLAGLGLGGVGIAVIEEDLQLTMFLKAAMAYLPAAWMMVGIAVLLLGWAPRFTGFMWLYIAFSFIVIYFGGLFQFPDWVQRLTPFGYVAKVPIENVDYGVLAALTAAAAVLLIIGFMGFNRRDTSQS